MKGIIVYTYEKSLTSRSHTLPFNAKSNKISYADCSGRKSHVVTRDRTSDRSKLSVIKRLGQVD